MLKVTLILQNMEIYDLENYLVNVEIMTKSSRDSFNLLMSLVLNLWNNLLINEFFFVYENREITFRWKLRIYN